ncbi:hypothetical protein PM082_023347 [Marasmius tenuissimus]|nr:hypothetical protein PM082_023347 [Marasmius tenuissimus]
MTTTITDIRVLVKEEKKPAGILPHNNKPPCLGSLSSSDPGTNPPMPNDPNSNSFKSTTTNRFSELEERGVKPECFKGDHEKTDWFCYNFERYL